MFVFGFLIFLICNEIFVHAKHSVVDYNNFQNHPCNRICKEGGERICKYELILDQYFTLAPECLGCINGNLSDCYNPLCIPGDGRTRVVTVYNSMLPGPPIQVCEGDLIKVSVLNKLSNGVTTSVHWHGMHQRSTQYMDGVPMITQCPIFSSFQYKFNASPSGTHFYHSHTGGQRTDGAFGPLVVRTPYENQSHKYDYDLSEHIITVTDWYNVSSEYHYLDYYRNNVHYKHSITAILVNGFGAKDSNKIPKKIFKVKKGKSYRFRLIHAGALVCPITLRIENHRMNIISTDGQDIKNITVDELTMMNGERYDIILNANQHPSRYNMTFVGGMYCQNLTTTATLEYKNFKEKRTPTHKQNKKKLIELNCVEDRNVTTTTCLDVKDLRSVNKLEESFRKKPCMQYYLAFGMYNHVVKRFQRPGDKTLFGMFINNISFIQPNLTLLQLPLEEEVKGCNFETPPKKSDDGFYECTHILEVKSRCVVELIFADEGSDTDTVAHPVHLHGYNFRVLSQGRLNEPVTNETFRLADERGEIERNFESPPLKDTVIIPDGGYTVVRFLSNNPGFWLLHCHVDFHAEEGMLMVLKIGDTRKITTPDFLPKC